MEGITRRGMVTGAAMAVAAVQSRAQAPAPAAGGDKTTLLDPPRPPAVAQAPSAGSSVNRCWLTSRVGRPSTQCIETSTSGAPAWVTS